MMLVERLQNMRPGYEIREGCLEGLVGYKRFIEMHETLPFTIFEYKKLLSERRLQQNHQCHLPRR